MQGVTGPVGAVRSGGAAGGGSNTRELIIAGVDFAANFNNFRERSLGAIAQFNWTFYIPFDFSVLLAAEMIGIPMGTNAAAPIDFDTEYGAVGEVFNTHTESSVGATFAITLNTILAIDLSPVLSSIAAGDYVGLTYDHQGIGTTINYIGLRLFYSV